MRSSRRIMNAGNKNGVSGTAKTNRPYLSHWSLNASQAEITAIDITTARTAKKPPEIKNARRKLILKGVSMSSRANVWSSGIVALKANTAPICTIVKINPASNRNRILLKISIGSASGEPISNSTK